jgi:hypothetical protein
VTSHKQTLERDEQALLPGAFERNCLPQWDVHLDDGGCPVRRGTSRWRSGGQ